MDALSGEMVTLVQGAGADTAQLAERCADGIKAFIDLATRHSLLLDVVNRLGVNTLGSDALTPALAAEGMAEVIAPAAAGDLSPTLARGIAEAATLALLLRVKVGAPVDIGGLVAAMLRALGQRRPPACSRARSCRSPSRPTASSSNVTPRGPGD